MRWARGLDLLVGAALGLAFRIAYWHVRRQYAEK